MASTYLKADVLSRAQALGLKARGLVEGLRVGDHKSPFRGFSVEFVQHREYVPGDDIRHIDWKGYGRSERYTIKQYEQETNYSGHILLDASRSMLYGLGSSNKLEYAKLLAATIAYVIIHQRDSAGLHVFDERWRTRVPPSGQPGHVLTLLKTLQSVDPRDKSSIGPLLHDFAGQVGRRGLVFLISDCFDAVPSLLSGLQHLRFQGHEVTVFHIMHPDELRFPFDGLVKFDGLEIPQYLLTRPHQIRPSYLRVVNKYLEELRHGCEASRVDYVLMDTARPLAETLSAYLARRLKTRVQPLAANLLESFVSFLAPYMLWGTLAAGIPIALHFFFRSRYRTVLWAAMEFLLQSIEQTSRRRRFQELLLLIVRVAVMLLLALALARPASLARSSSGSGDAVDAVFLFDTSYSMDAREGLTTRFDRAKAAALAVLDHLPPNSTVQIVTCADRAESLGPHPAADRDQAHELIGGLRVSQLATDLLPGLHEAVSLLGRGTSANRELYLFSDMQKLGWERQPGPLAEQWRAAEQLATIYMVRCGSRTSQNAAVIGVVPQSGLPRAGERVGFAVLVRNAGAEPLRDLTVSLTLDGNEANKESQPLAYLAPGETRTVTLSGKWDQPGNRVVSATVEPDDLNADNRLDLVVPVRERVRVLVVDGALDEREPAKSSSYYLLHALMPVKESDRPKYYLQARLVTPALASPALLADKDLCILVNAPAEDDRPKRIVGMSPEFTDALERFVKGGKPLLMFAGDRVDPEAYNHLFGEAHGLLPLKLTSVRTLPVQGELAIDRTSARDPAFWRFRDDDAYKALSAVHTVRYLEGDELPPAADARGAEPILLRLNNGKPLVAVRKAGGGKVMLVTTSADATWTDWPLWLGTYVPFVDVATNYLLMSTAQDHNGMAGQPIRWWPPAVDAVRPFLLHRPDGRRVRLGMPELVEGRALVTAPDTPLAGVYRVLPADAEANETGVPFALVADPQEGLDLTVLTDAQLDEKLGFTPKHLVASEDLSAFTGGERLKSEWAPWILAVVLLLAAFEAGFAYWCGLAR